MLGYPSLEVEDRPSVLRALRWYEQGLDFADALHIASSAPAQRFATFDAQLARRVRRIKDAPPVDRL